MHSIYSLIYYIIIYYLKLLYNNIYFNGIVNIYIYIYIYILAYIFINLILIICIEITKLINLLMVQPSTSVSCERSFSMLMLMLRRLNTWLTQQTIYSTILDAMRLKVPELIRRFDDNLRSKALNYSIVLWTLLRPKRRICDEFNMIKN